MPIAKHALFEFIILPVVKYVFREYVKSRLNYFKRQTLLTLLYCGYEHYASLELLFPKFKVCFHRALGGANGIRASRFPTVQKMLTVDMKIFRMNVWP